MERLTKNVPAVNIRAVPVNIDTGFAIELTDNTWLGLQEIFDRLCQYEDTGLTPEQIKMLADSATEKVAKALAEVLPQLVQAIVENLPQLVEQAVDKMVGEIKEGQT